jgi:hypothetical protein
LEAFLTTNERLDIFKKLVQDSIDEYWNEDIYNENCPDEEYDYESAGEEEPQDVDIDDYPEYDMDDEAENNMTIREIMDKRLVMRLLSRQNLLH